MFKKLLIFTALIFLTFSSYAFAQNRPLLNFIKNKLAAKNSSNIEKIAQNKHRIVINGIKRSYYLFTPSNYSSQKIYPVIFAFHGGGGNAYNILNMTNFKSYIDDYDFILIAPNGSGNNSNEMLLTWNAGNCCGYALEQSVNEADFINAIIEQSAKDYSINRNQIFLTGMSNGAMLSHRLACELSDKIAGIATVSGAMNFEQCSPSKPIKAIIFNGKKDEHVRYDGGVPSKNMDKRNPRIDNPVFYAVNFWVNNNHCSPKPHQETFGNIIIDKYLDCNDNQDVTLYTIVDGKHAWPGGEKGSFLGDEPTNEINATQIILNSFIPKQ
ncbi:MAG: PHB depolymerase family esterase [Alphaproteobacteria bacterium]